MIVIVDYGMGNLRSVQKALESAGTVARIVSTPDEIGEAQKLVLPGVGAFRPAMERLDELGLSSSIRQFAASGRPFLGICLGYQLLFDVSSEGGEVPGLGILSGRVERFSAALKVPHMGWNSLRPGFENAEIFSGLTPGAYVYFCHSYYVIPQDRDIVAAWTDYGGYFAAAVCSGKIWGVQFHPEKSQQAGLQILKNFVELA